MPFLTRFPSFAFIFTILAMLSCTRQGPAQEIPSIVPITGKHEPGKPFTLDIQVLDVATKQSVAGVEVFAYHTNSKGDYEEDRNGVARLHGTALSDAKGNLKFITIYPRGYNDSPTGEHIHFSVKGSQVVAGNTDLMFADYYEKRYDYDHPATNKCYLKSLEEKEGGLYGKAIIYVRKN